MNILGYVIRKLKGSLRCAKEEGMVVGKFVIVLGGGFGVFEHIFFTLLDFL